MSSASAAVVSTMKVTCSMMGCEGGGGRVVHHACECAAFWCSQCATGYINANRCLRCMYCRTEIPRWSTTTTTTQVHSSSALDVLRQEERGSKKQRRRDGRGVSDEHEVDYIAGVQRIAGAGTYYKIVWKPRSGELPSNGDWKRPVVTWEPVSDGDGRDMLLGCKVACLEYLERHKIPALVPDGTMHELFCGYNAPWVRFLPGSNSPEFSCGELGCDVTAATKFNMLRHCVTKHPVLPPEAPSSIQCALCEERFSSRKDNMVRHARRLHVVKGFDEAAWAAYVVDQSEEEESMGDE